MHYIINIFMFISGINLFINVLHFIYLEFIIICLNSLYITKHIKLYAKRINIKTICTI